MHADVLRQMNDVKPAVFAGQRVEHRGGVVRGRIVDNNHLELAVRLPQNRIDTTPNIRPDVEGWNYHRDQQEVR